MAIPNTTSGNLTASISDHLPQFLIAANIFSISLILSPINMKEAGQDLIKKLLFFITFS